MREGASQSCCDDDEAVSIEDGVKEKQARDILGILNCLSEPQLLDLQGGLCQSEAGHNHASFLPSSTSQRARQPCPTLSNCSFF